MKLKYKDLYYLDESFIRAYFEIFIWQYIENIINNNSEYANNLKNPNWSDLERISFPHQMILQNNILPEIKELFISNLRLKYFSLKESKASALKNKLRLFVSTIENETIDSGMGEYETSVRIEVRNTIIDIKSFLSELEVSKVENILEEFLLESGFDKLNMVKCLTNKSKSALIDELNNKSKTDIPGFLAFVYFLGLYDHLFKKFNSRSKAYKVLAQIVNRKEDTIKGHISSFVDNSYAKGKYNSYLKLPEVKDFYNNLKFGG